MCRTSKVALDLKSVVFRRIMAGRDDDSPCCTEFLRQKRHHGSRGNLVGNGDADSAIPQHFRRGLGEFSREKSGVVADDDPFGDLLVATEIIRSRQRDASDIVECEVSGDNTSPTIGAEVDSHREINAPVNSLTGQFVNWESAVIPIQPKSQLSMNLSRQSYSPDIRFLKTSTSS